ncbi:MAG: polysaccharide deacetylase family protein [Chloroflexia bacterium]|nr:polysaccharide deacetylase family protein [Chloroflexia bacterium]
MTRCRLPALLAVLVLCLSLMPSETKAQGWDGVYFPETGHHVPQNFADAWWRFGGLPIIGYPVSEPFGRDGLLVQHFERAVMEWHSENDGTPYEVQLELLGNWISSDHQAPAFERVGSPASSDEQRTWFAETGHTLHNDFKRYWETHGGLIVFGYPISEEFVEDVRTVQYFERARFEWWPENRGTVYEVQLGHLGVARAVATGFDMAAVPRQDGVPDYNAQPISQSFNLPVLMYHQLGEPESRYQISMWRFAEQLDWLQVNGYTTITLTEAYNALLGFTALPDKPVVVTFDDGYTSHWDAAAALDRRGMRGVFFITLGQPRMADWQIKDISDRGHEIGSHTISHPDLTSLSAEQLAYELEASRSELRAITQHPIDFFAYPYGASNERVVVAVQAAGYRGAVAAWGGTGWHPELRWMEPRVEIAGYLSLGEFAAFVQ